MIGHKLEIFKNDLENPLNCKLVWTVAFLDCTELS